LHGIHGPVIRLYCSGQRNAEAMFIKRAFADVEGELLSPMMQQLISIAVGRRLLQTKNVRHERSAMSQEKIEH
jgi:hypothetical protein